ncbi:Pnap_2097 family protein [Gemmobacter caeruleus]|uniref:Pnap_2097 family protein n=1 Tax=Gemmobacter caeruleus TaxID=2595004 RepID=UPI0011ED6A86|nr:Pnap_2097 family protein [Gemmobacter caeruleus]
MKHERIERCDTIGQRRLGMAECGWRGLSEGWLLRHLGDVHWRQIADAMGQQAAVFHDATGAPVYAAFCAISERIAQPELARPGALLTIASRLRRLSATRLISFHSLDIGGEDFAEVTLITAFVRHGVGGNAHIRRAQPVGKLDLPMMEAGADDGFAEEAAQLYRGAGSAGDTLQTDVTPCPTTEFNAAGLLYCANYPALADRAEWALYPEAATRMLTRRKIVFLGNVDAGERVTAAVHTDRAKPDRHSITLASNGRVIAQVVTEKLS